MEQDKAFFRKRTDRKTAFKTGASDSCGANDQYAV